MAKGFSPLIGLAVVVALAMVAVFGALSLNNATPVLAQDATVPAEVYLGVIGQEVNLVPHLPDDAVVESVGTILNTVPAVATVTTTTTFGSFGAIVSGLTTGSTTALIPVNLVGGSTVTITLNIDVLENTPATAAGSIPRQQVAAGTPASTGVVATVGEEKTLDLKPYFANGGGPDGEITGYTFTSGAVTITVSPDTSTDASTDGIVTLQAAAGTAAGTSVIVTATAVDSDSDLTNNPVQTFFVTVVAAGAPVVDEAPAGIEVTATGSDPGENPSYTLTFTATKPFDSGTDVIKIKMEDFGVPSSISTSRVNMRITDGPSTVDPPAVEDNDPGPLADQAANPEAITVDGDELSLTVPDFGDAGDGDQGILVGDEVTIVFQQSAGITNPTEGATKFPGKAYPWEVDDTESTTSVEVPIIISIDEDEPGRGDEVVVTGSGYKNGTTLTFWRDSNADGDKDAGEIELCSVNVGSSDSASCSFDVGKPPFQPGTAGNVVGDSCDVSGITNCNFINAADGRDNRATLKRDDDGNATDQEEVDDLTIELVPSLSASPSAASPGETVLLQLRDFPAGTVRVITLADETVTDSGGTIPQSGDYNQKIVIPNNVPEGKQSLKLNYRPFGADEDENERVTLDIGGPVLRATPADVVPNQRISLVGTGFSRVAPTQAEADANDGIEDVDVNKRQIKSITIGGQQISPNRINGGQPVSVDNGGNWSTSIDLPLTSATTAEGSREVRVRDTSGREGSLLLNFGAREVTITPESGRVGTLAAIRGMNFPGKNDDGTSFNVQVVYDAGGNRQTTVSAVPDASGRFEVELRIPTAASIPSTNTVKVEFVDESGVTVVTTVAHEVPEGAITLSRTSGPPGSTVTLSGIGFKSFVPITSVMVGDIEVTPSPTPATDDQGMMTFNVLIPGLDVGIQTIEVQVGGTTASAGFTLTPSGVSAGNITEAALATVNLGDNFVRSFNFNNDTKSWTFYSPEAPDASTQTNFITGESYWILITESQEVILNGKTRNLTCAAGSCWNQIVW